MSFLMPEYVFFFFEQTGHPVPLAIFPGIFIFMTARDVSE